jgi:hypothetical protein
MTQSIAGVYDAMFSSFTTLYANSIGTDGAPVLVTFGPPGQYEPSAIVAIQKAAGQITRPTMGTNRSREMAADIDIWISVFTSGDETAQQVSTDCAFDLLTLLEQNLRTAPNERFGGVCRDATISGADPEFTVAVDPATGNPAGRVTDIHATLSALIRY